MARTLTPDIIRAAIDGFENQKKQIDSQITELKGLLDGNAPEADGSTPETTARKRRKFSAAAIRRMKAAQQKRWAKIRGEVEPVQQAATTDIGQTQTKIKRCWTTCYC